MTDGGTSASLSRARERVRASALRAAPTAAESLLWSYLRGRRLSGFKFRRQRPIGPYFADFACLETQLVVELDGGQHTEAVRYDKSRTRYLEEQGFRVLRFWNHQVMTETDAVLAHILQAVSTPPHPNPLPPAGEGASQQGHCQ